MLRLECDCKVDALVVQACEDGVPFAGTEFERTAGLEVVVNRLDVTHPLEGGIALPQPGGGRRCARSDEQCLQTVAHRMCAHGTVPSSRGLHHNGGAETVRAEHRDAPQGRHRFRIVGGGERLIEQRACPDVRGVEEVKVCRPYAREWSAQYACELRIVDL